MPAGLVELVIPLVAIVFGSIIAIEYLKTRRTEAGANDGTLNEDTARQIAELEERVRTLERIATDKSERLSREIDNLS